MKERSNDLSPERQAAVAHALGVGAVKYADLSTERAAATSSTGTGCWPSKATPGPYLQYAHARVRSIFRRAGVAPPPPGAVPLLGEPQERALALHLLGFAAAVEVTAEILQPVQALHLSVRARHLVHHVLRGLPGAGGRRGGARLEARAVRPHGTGVGARALPAGYRGARPDVTGARPAPILCPARQVRAGGGSHERTPQCRITRCAPRALTQCKQHDEELTRSRSDMD